MPTVPQVATVTIVISLQSGDIVVQVAVSSRLAELGNYAKAPRWSRFSSAPDLRATTRAAQAHRVQPRAVAAHHAGPADGWLSSQATVAATKPCCCASTAPRLFPMLVTAAGTLPAARVLVLGAGVAGLQAIATARRLGAIVSAFDVVLR